VLRHLSLTLVRNFRKVTLTIWILAISVCLLHDVVQCQSPTLDWYSWLHRSYYDYHGYVALFIQVLLQLGGTLSSIASSLIQMSGKRPPCAPYHCLFTSIKPLVA